MGQMLRKSYFRGKKEVKIYMHGLDAAGKTTILYKLKLGEVASSIPTIGFEIEHVTYKNISITAWDVGGRCHVRPLFRYYYKQGVDAVLFVIDSNDRERLEEVKDELYRLIQEDDLRDTVFLILANKQDLPRAMGLEELTEAIDFNSIMKSHRANIMGTIATTGDGLYEALDWLSGEISSGRPRPSSASNTGRNGTKEIDTNTLGKSPGDKSTTPWSFKSYLKGGLEAFKKILL